MTASTLFQVTIVQRLQPSEMKALQNISSDWLFKTTCCIQKLSKSKWNVAAKISNWNKWTFATATTNPFANQSWRNIKLKNPKGEEEPEEKKANQAKAPPTHPTKTVLHIDTLCKPSGAYATHSFGQVRVSDSFVLAFERIETSFKYQNFKPSENHKHPRNSEHSLYLSFSIYVDMCMHVLYSTATHSNSAR